MPRGWSWLAADATAPGGEFGAVGGAEFGAGAVEVVFHGAHRDDQPLGDVAVGQPAGGEGDDFAFPVGEGQWCGDGGQGGGGDAFAGLGELVGTGGGGVGGAAPVLAGVDGGSLGSGIGRQEPGPNLLELDRGGCSAAPSSVARAAACAAAAGAREPSTWVASWVSRSATVRSPKQTAVCNATTPWRVGVGCGDLGGLVGEREGLADTALGGGHPRLGQSHLPSGGQHREPLCGTPQRCQRQEADPA